MEVGWGGAGRAMSPDSAFCFEVWSQASVTRYRLQTSPATVLQHNLCGYITTCMQPNEGRVSCLTRQRAKPTLCGCTEGSREMSLSSDRRPVSPRRLLQFQTGWAWVCFHPGWGWIGPGLVGIAFRIRTGISEAILAISATSQELLLCEVDNRSYPQSLAAGPALLCDSMPEHVYLRVSRA